MCFLQVRDGKMTATRVPFEDRLDDREFTLVTQSGVSDVSADWLNWREFRSKIPRELFCTWEGDHISSKCFQHLIPFDSLRNERILPCRLFHLQQVGV
jgi:hypothetical protein